MSSFPKTQKQKSGFKYALSLSSFCVFVCLPRSTISFCLFPYHHNLHRPLTGSGVVKIDEINKSILP